MKSIRKVLTTATVVCLAALCADAATLQDNINGSATPPFVFYGGPNNIGWYYTAGSSYLLDGIYTFFEPVPNGTGAHHITVQMWTDRPASGGTLLGQGSFDVDSSVGGTQGANFAPVTIHAGQTYFVDYLNTIGMGVNLGQWTDNGSGPQPSAGATFNTGGWYGESAPNNNDTFPNSSFVSGGAYYTTATGNVSFSEPILRFFGDPIPTTGTPEPGTLGLMGSALLLLVKFVRRKPVY
jgi:hypothetical protein